MEGSSGCVRWNCRKQGSSIVHSVNINTSIYASLYSILQRRWLVENIHFCLFSEAANTSIGIPFLSNAHPLLPILVRQNLRVIRHFVLRSYLGHSHLSVKIRDIRSTTNFGYFAIRIFQPHSVFLVVFLICPGEEGGDIILWWQGISEIAEMECIADVNTSTWPSTW